MPGARARTLGAWLALAALASACFGPQTRPVTRPIPAGTELRITAGRDSVMLTGTDFDRPSPTCAMRQVEGHAARQSGDTIVFDSLRTVLARHLPAPAECVTNRTAIVVLMGPDVRVERLVPLGVLGQAAGIVLFSAAVGGTILLLVSAADGLIDLIDRWF